MTLILLLTICISITLFLLVYAFLKYREENSSAIVRDRILDMGKDNGDIAQQYWQRTMSAPLVDRLLGPATQKLADLAKRIAPKGFYKDVSEKVELAGGFPGGVPGFFITLAHSAVICFLLSVWYVFSSKLTFGGDIFALACGIGCGIGLPFLYLKSKTDERREAIRRALPDILDLLCVSVQAGLGFDAALGRVTAKMHGPLVDELDRLLQELRMGVQRRSALQRLSHRCGIQEMQLITAALIQAERLGVGMAQVLEIQSENMRELRRQRSQEEAAKLPVKILFPTLLFIFPVLFAVSLAPPLITVMRQFLNK